jgi:hypothetical protein
MVKYMFISIFIQTKHFFTFFFSPLLQQKAQKRYTSTIHIAAAKEKVSFIGKKTTSIFFYIKNKITSKHIVRNDSTTTTVQIFSA